MITTRIRVGALVFVAAVLTGAGARAEIIEQILVKVNGEIITKTELETRQVGALRATGQAIDPKAGDDQLRAMLRDVTPRLIVDAIDEMLLVQRGRELGYKMTEEQYQSILDNLKQENKITSDDDFQAALKQENMTLADLRKNLERQWVVSRVQQNEVLGRVGVTEEEARRYYDAHKTEFTTVPSVTLREILVGVAKDASADTDAAARQKAAAIRVRAMNGESFEKLAADLSDSPSRANAGIIGPLNLGDGAPDLKALIEKMKPGDISDTMRAPGGYELLKLESITGADTTPFDEARNDIGNRVFTDKRKTELDKYLAKIRAEAIIEWKNDELKKEYEQGLAPDSAKGKASQ